MLTDHGPRVMILGYGVLSLCSQLHLLPLRAFAFNYFIDLILCISFSLHKTSTKVE